MRHPGAWVIALAVLWGGPALARAETCDSVARQAALAQDVPVDVMLAVTRLETGRKRNGQFQPWPWTANVAGQGHWFDTAEDLRGFLAQQVRAGRQNFDVGCFQINYRWHGHAFASLQDMVDPHKNALYAARFLRDLYDEKQDWTAAVGAYHSRTPRYAQRYTARFSRIRSALSDRVVQVTTTTDSATAHDSRPRENRFVLLRSGGSPGARGSLVPQGDRGQPLFGPPLP